MGTTGTHTMNAALSAKLPYDPIKDFAPISLVVESPFLLVVHPSLPATATTTHAYRGGHKILRASY